MSEKTMKLEYRTPASQWCEALPIGNGRIGAMIYGGLTEELLQINEETVWAGNYVDRTNPKAAEALDKVREAIFSGRNHDAEIEAEGMLGVPMNIQSYQPLCDVVLHLERKGILENYRRCLHLTDGLYTQSFTRRGDRKEFSGHAEAFASLEDDIIVWKRSLEDPETEAEAEITLRRMSDVLVETKGNRIYLSGTVEGGGVDFCCGVEVRADGEIQTLDHAIRVIHGHSLELRISGYTTFADGSDPKENCEKILDLYSNQSFEWLKERHVEAFREVASRQELTFTDDEAVKPVLELMNTSDDKTRDNDMYALFYNYLRYLIISSCEKGRMPSNLQGIWNDNMRASWNSDYHPNVNLQINYWPVEGFNLPECIRPLADWLERISVAGAKTAKEHYRAGGWVLHHLSDIYCCTTPMDGMWGVWPFGGIWLMRNLYEHYLFEKDRSFLKEKLFPMVEGAVEFLLDFLMICPDGIPGAGKYVTCPSHSPENRYLDQNGESIWLTYGATMDIEITTDLFEIYQNLCREMNLTGQFEERVREVLGNLPEIKISKRYGGIQEWIDDYEEFEPGHRHVSPLYALFPGVQINESTPELMEGARKMLERRLTHHYHGQGWSYGWIACLYARLGDGNKALEILDRILSETALPNLMIVAHGWPQVGDAQAFAAAVQEMIVQSHLGEIRVLPALPDRWNNGQMKGIRIRGGHLLNLTWKDGVLTEAVLIPGSTETVKVRLPGKQAVELQVTRKAEVDLLQIG